MKRIRHWGRFKWKNGWLMKKITTLPETIIFRYLRSRMLPLKPILTMLQSINSLVKYQNFTRNNTDNIKLRRFSKGTSLVGRIKKNSRTINKIEIKSGATNTSLEVVVLPHKLSTLWQDSTNRLSEERYRSKRRSIETWDKLSGTALSKLTTTRTTMWLMACPDSCHKCQSMNDTTRQVFSPC
jgi:hypothetical protein